MADEAKPTRRWLKWTVIGVWLLTAGFILVLATLHPHSPASVSVRVSEITFHTTAAHLLDSTKQDEVSITGIRYVNILGHLKIDGERRARTVANLLGSSYGTCTFTRVRAGAVRLSGNTSVTLSQTGNSRDAALGLMVNQPVRGSLTTQAAEEHIAPGFSCTRVRIDGSSMPGPLNGVLSMNGGDSIDFATDAPARIDFDPGSNSILRDTQIPVSGEILGWRSEPNSQDYKTVLLPAPDNEKNQISFESPDKTMLLGDADLFEIRPGTAFWIKSIEVNKGIRLNLQGVVVDIRTGPGVSALRSRMPSLLDRLLTLKGLLALIPAAAAAVLGFLEKLGLLPKA